LAGQNSGVGQPGSPRETVVARPVREAHNPEVGGSKRALSPWKSTPRYPARLTAGPATLIKTFLCAVEDDSPMVVECLGAESL